MTTRFGLAVLRDRRGISAAEYAVLAAGVVAVVAVATLALGNSIATIFNGLLT